MTESETKPCPVEDVSSQPSPSEGEVEVHTRVEGCYYKAKGKRLGPYSVKDKEAVDFKLKIAAELGLKPEEILVAELRNLEKPTSIEEINNILSTTIKRDNPTKAILFLTMLLTYTEEDQQNDALQAESAAGKSYIPLELAGFFPEEDLLVIASASPTAFFHETGTWDEERKVIVVSLERKILIFLDQPHYMLMERLRPLLSHDRKELQYKITDKSEKKGLRTKNVVIRGYPTIIFCSAKLDLDEQEKTRVFLLSPEVAEEKILESIYLLGEKLGNRDHFRGLLESDARRIWLRNRVHAIRTAGIRDVVIENWRAVCERFLNAHPNLAPRHQRDFPRLIALIKGHALLNWAQREALPDKRIKANFEDIEAGFRLYGQVANPNELGLSPQVYEIYQRVVKPILKSEGGVDKKVIIGAYHKVYHRPLPYRKLRDEILPILESVGLISLDPDPADKRRTLVYPTDVWDISSGLKDEDLRGVRKNNVPRICGVVGAEIPLKGDEPENVPELINQLRRKFKKGRQDEFEDLARKLGCTDQKARFLFSCLVDEGMLAMNPDGFWVWT